MWIKESLIVSLLAVATAAAHVGQEAGLKRHAQLAARAHDNYLHVLKRAGSANPRKSCKANANATTTSFSSHTSTHTSSSSSKPKTTAKVTSGSSSSGGGTNGNGKVISTPGSFTPNGI